MSRTEYAWEAMIKDPRVPNLDRYGYEIRYSFNPKGYEVVKRNLNSGNVVEVVASGLKRDAAEGFIKILEEN